MGRGADDEHARNFAEKSGYDWAVGVDRKGETYFAAGSPGLPRVFLVSPDGRVLWEGSSGALTNAVLDGFLDRARLWRSDEIEKPVRPAAEAFASGKYGAAWKKSDEALAGAAKKRARGDTAAADAEETDANLVKQGVDFIATLRLGIAEKLAKERWSIDAKELLEGLAASCAGCPQEAKVKEALDAIARDARAQKEIEAMVRLREILGKIGKPSRLKVTQALSALDDFMTPYGNLVAGERAKAEKARLEKLLADLK